MTSGKRRARKIRYLMPHRAYQRISAMFDWGTRVIMGSFSPASRAFSITSRISGPKATTRNPSCEIATQAPEGTCASRSLKFFMFAAGAIVLTSNLSAGDLPNVKRNTDYHSGGERLAQVSTEVTDSPSLPKVAQKQGFSTMMLDEGLECKYKRLSGVCGYW